MTGIRLTPCEAQAVIRTCGKAGFRELFLDPLIHEILADSPLITPAAALIER